MGGGGREKTANGKSTENGDTNQSSPKSTDKLQKQSEEDDDRIPPPDGGWGWMVVLASFIIHVIADGIVYSFGIFYIEFLDYYKGGKGETAWVGSLVPGVTLSVGLAVCGSGLGAFIFNPFSKYLIDEFGWRGAILIEAGIILNCVICGAMFRPLQRRKGVKGAGGKSGGNKEKQPLMMKDSELVKDRLELELVVHAHGDDDYTTASQPSSPNHVVSQMTLLDAPPRRETALFRSEGALHRTGSGHKPVVPSPLTVDSTGQQRPPGVRRQHSEDHHHYHQHHHYNHRSGARHPTALGGNLYGSGSLMNISLQRSHPALYIASIASIPHEHTDIQKRLCCCLIPADLYFSLKQMCDLSLLKDYVFLMFVISNFFTSIGFNMPFIFLTDRAVDEGISEEDAKWLVSAIGISNTVGRVLFGFLADRRGVYVSLTSVVLVDLLGLEMLTNSFGLLLMFQGIATLVGPPIAGWLYDGTGSYDISFIVAGIVVAFSGVMLFFIPLVRKCLIIDDESVSGDEIAIEDGEAV
ncbi:MOT5-like protein [Mya arenaria]|uniref:MOT5-like protein n=1 Tax=Mya arenaria TaxID=6604 RepID=A0ABY7G7X7_MYAAR|nr:MOT5-like protein [Mya arenaria]